ncbi:ACP S-malonyltransferase [Mycoplasma sp. P36-A1]|uniref:ACP S-malonyltransferase n=1 Tax=Mycoplasma sp. P36-A1 TaxID=3252900 RepID=UPI003C2E5A7F
MRALLFAGQGQQYLGMALDLLENYQSVRDVFDKASKITKIDLIALLEDEKMNKTTYTQPLMLTLNQAIFELLIDNNIEYDYVAGLSLGEYNALIAADVISFEDALKIVQQRALIMDSATKPYSTSMAAVLKADISKITEVLNSEELENKVGICNINTFDQIVIGGSKEKLSQAIELLKDAGFKRVIPLEVSTVSHMHLLNDASLKLNKVLKEYEFKKPTKNFINNVEAKIQTDNYSDSLTRHIAQPTKMANIIDLMLDNGVEEFVEVGPKKVLSGFVKSIAKKKDKNVIIDNVYDYNTLNQYINKEQ